LTKLENKLGSQLAVSEADDENGMPNTEHLSSYEEINADST